MKTRGASAATSLLLAFCLVTETLTLEVKTEGNSTKDSISGTDQKQVIVEEVIIARNGNRTKVSASAIAEDPTKFTDQILSLLMDDRNATKKSSKRSVDQSQSLLLNVQDVKDLENLEDALSVIEYEPQKIANRKTKRKTQRPTNDFNDSNLSPASTDDLVKATAEEIYYKIPQNVQGYDRRNLHPEATAEDPQKYYSSSSAAHGNEPINPTVTKPKHSKNRNVQIVQENLPPIKKPRLKPIKSRLQVNPKFSPYKQVSTEKIQYEDVPKAKIAATLKPYPRSSSEARRAKYSSDSAVAAPTNNNSQSVRTTKRKKRRRIAAKPTQEHVVPVTEQESENIDRYNINVTPNPTHNTQGLQRQGKPQAFGILAKYDVAPRSFSLAKTHAPDADNESTTKRQHKYVTLNRNRNPNREPPKRKNAEAVENDNYPLPYAKVTESMPLKSSVHDSENAYGTRNQGRSHEEASDVALRTSQHILPRAERITAYGNSESPKFLSEASSTKTYERPVESANSEDASLERYSSYQAAPSKSTSQEPTSYEGTKNSPSSTDLSKHAEPQTFYYATSNPHSSNWVYVPNVAPTKSAAFEAADLTASNFGKGNVAHEAEGEKVEARIDQVVKKSDSTVEGTHPQSKREEQRPRSHGGYKIYELLAKGHDGGSQSKTADSNGHDYHHSSEENHEHNGYGNRKANNDDHHDSEQKDDREEHGHGSAQGHESYKEEESRGGDKKGHGGGAKGDDGSEGTGGGDHDHESGGSDERSKEHREAEGEKGEKGYKSWHEHDKANKGHHDKEQHSNYYDEKDGEEKEHKEDGAYHEEHQRGEKAEKGSEFGEKGEHQKGHSTKGQHFIHKKDEFEKKTEFFDEFEEEGDAEKEGEEYAEHEAAKGGREKSSHLEEEDHVEKYGKKSGHVKGGHYHENKGHKIGEGQESHYDHGEAHGKKGAQHDGKKWAYKKPAEEAKDEKSR